MRAYTLATAAFALDVDTKWIDNLLSHHTVPGVVASKRGVRRRIPPRSILIIAIAHALSATLGMPLHRALELAIAMESSGGRLHQVSNLIQLRIDLVALQTDLARRLNDAAEFAAVPRRGRPPHHATASGS